MCYNGIKNNNLATVNSATTTVGTISSGGYVKAGRLVTYNITIVTPSAVDAYIVILSGLPSIISNGSPVICVNGNTGSVVDGMYLSGQSILSSISVPASTYVFSGSYISTS